MPRASWFHCALATVLFSACAVQPASRPYPATRTVAQTDTYHGVKIADPYRWLEDDNSPETKAWVEAENKVTFDFLEKIPQREAIRKRLTQLWNFQRYGVPEKHGSRYFFSQNNGLQNQNVLYVLNALAGEPRVLLDPNQLSADGTVALSETAFTDDGALLAYGLSTAGSDWQEWHVRDVSSGRDFPDVVKWAKSSASWSKDKAGFYYSRYDEPKPGQELTAVNKFEKLYYHRLGTPQAEDKLIYQRADHEDWGFGGIVTDDGRYLIIYVSTGTDVRNRIFYQDLAQPAAPVVELLNDFDAEYEFIGNDGPVFWFKTNLDAPRKRVIAIDTTRPQRANWRELVPQNRDTLEVVSAINDSFICIYMEDAHSVVKIHALDGRLLREVALPGLGSANGFYGMRSDTETFYSFSSYTTPGTIYRLDPATGASTVFRQPKVNFDSSAYETRQVFYTSKDGTRVPMFITAKKGLVLNGQNPTLLYGYGGFAISLEPRFSIARAVWMEMGGIYAVANLRGGGEYGEDWHQAGMKLKKQNVFDDFIAATQWLIDNKYTSAPKLAIAGDSNGGLLVGACLTQRPDLFGAALPGVGVMDMLRFNKFTIGWAWMSDYGSPDDPTEFKALLAYSPLHNIHPGTTYPATLITTADHDDRVVPAHSFKFAATLQAAQAGPAPVLIRIETRAGHGGGMPTDKVIAEFADQWAFLVKELDVELPKTPAFASADELISRMTSEVTDTAQYQTLLTEYWENSELVGHFPRPIPANATNVRFSFLPAFLQGGAHIQLRYVLPSGEVARLYEHFSSLKTKSFFGGETNVHINEAEGMPTTRFYTNGGPSQAFPGDYEIMIFDPVAKPENFWNHGQSHGVAISRQRREIVYWAEHW